MAQGKWIKTFILSTLTAIIFTFTPGCWDAQEPNKLGIVVGIGIDRLDTGKIHLTLSGINTVGGQQGGKSQSGAGSPPIKNLETDGNTLDDAFTEAEARASRHPYYAHNAVIVFSAAYAKKGYSEAISYLQRNRSFRQSQLLLVTSGSPTKILGADVGVEAIPALGLRDLSEAKDNAYAYESTGLEDTNGRIAPSNTSILSRVEVDSHGRNVVQNVGVFESGKLRYFASPSESRGLLWLLNKVHKGTLKLSQSQGFESEPTAVRLLSIHCDVEPHVSDSQPTPTFTIHVRGIGELIHISPTDAKQTPKSVRVWGRMADKQVQSELQEAITAAQMNKTDAPQFGSELFRTNPKAWRRISDKWPEIFPNVRANYDVQINLIRAGLIGDNPEKFSDRNMLPPEKGR